jgi:hypothetical protein
MNARIVSFAVLATLGTSQLVFAEDDAGAPLPPTYSSQWNATRAAGNAHFGSPEDQARPGEAYFNRGVDAIRKKDFRFATDMYKVAASWAYKPAEYNLAIMYAKGEGVPVDKPLAMAWAALAAERGDANYVAAREVIYATLSKEEFAKANDLWRDLKKTYGDDIALKRAEVRWAEVKNNVTGSHVGSVGHITVGNGWNTGHDGAFNPETAVSGAAEPFSDTAFGVVGGGATDGAVAYRQLKESKNPYDPKFERREGTATVEPIVPQPDAPAPTTPKAHDS